MELSLIQKRSIFKDLAAKSQFLVGKDYKFDQYYKSDSGITNAVNKVYREVKENPEAFAITQDVLELVEKAMETRRTNKPAVRNTFGDVKVDQKQLIVGANNKAWILLNRKLDYLAKNKQAFRNESIMSIAKVAGIVFDKTQISKGEATEHIMLKAKIDQNITPEQALTSLLQFRDAQTQDGESD